ncbi:FixH family protein [Nocardioides gansuensis]|uniref:copper resistance CopC/CopD family protein n=1 Tax=Nocardioides gansuensis TaxID=2138300 RepID=UPI001403B566|nr:FixH family protein [Nocardioides gansuensis]
MTDVPRRSSRWRAIRLVTAAAACLLAVVSTAPPAAAHATLLSTDPVDGAVLAESPGAATFSFDEPVTVAADAVRVFDAAGEPVESTATTRDRVMTVDLPDELADGSYVVAWRVVSADGHPVAGSLTFAVGEPSPRVEPPPVAELDDPAVTTALSITQAIVYLGLFLTVGLAVFLAFLLPAGVRADRPRERARRVVSVASACCALAAVLSVPLGILDQQGIPVANLADADSWTSVTAGTLVALVLLLAGLLAVRLSLGSRLDGPRARGVLLAGVALAVSAPAVTGHTRTFGPQAVVIATDVLHVLAGGVWLGGLAGLALTLPTIAGRGSDAAVTLARWSTVAAGVLAALVASGSLLAWRIVGSWDGLLHTTYGRMLLVKIGLVAVAVALATWNRFVLLPRARSDDGHREQRASAVRLWRVVSAEVAVVVLVLGLTGFLVDRPPRASAEEVPEGRTGVVATMLGEEHQVLATLSPGRVGQNTVRIQLQDLAGEPVEPSRLPVVRVRSSEVDLGELDLTSDAAGTFRAEVVLPEPGRWEIQVSQRLGEFDNPVGVLTVEVD